MPPFSNTQPPILNATDVFTAGLALLAFVMALYALAAREQKTPYITNSVYSTALIVLIAILLSTLSKFIGPKNAQWADAVFTLSSVFLGIGILMVFFRVWRVQNRKINFRDDNLIKNLKLVRWIKNILRSIRRQPTYEHNPLKFPDPLIHSIKDCTPLSSDQLEAAFKRNEAIGATLSISAACRVTTFSQADQLLSKLALCFLNHQCWVQYTTCARHPAEFLLQLQKTWNANSKEKGKDWQEVARQVIAVDAYSPHFGFTDSIHDEFTKRLKEQGIDCITARASYAGVHTASARAFNRMKEKAETQKKEGRKATLAIYEGASALVELESTEQYRIFIRHVLPSERLWGGMFTFVVESTITEQNLDLLRTYSDLWIDLAPHPRPNDLARLPGAGSPSG
jgi:hypothetical protein